MRSRRFVGGALLTAMAAAVVFATARDERSAAAAESEVVKELETYYADFSARKWEAFASHFWSGATITTIWRPEGEAAVRVFVQRISEFVAEAPKGPGSKPIFEERMTAPEVRMGKNLAQVWARYEARFGEPGKVQRWTGVDAFTLMRHGGRWRIVSLVFENNE